MTPAGAAVTYDPDGPLSFKRSRRCNSAPACCTICRRLLPSPAPSPVSYLRLTPNRWAPTVIDIVKQDRGAALRVCPVFAATTPKKIAEAFNLEFRVSDGSASSYAGAWRDDLRRCRRHRAEARSAELCRRGRRLCRARLGKRSTAWREAPPSRNGSARLFARPIFATSALGLPIVAALDPPDLCTRYAEVYWASRASRKHRRS
mgnify:CR=1 FL=1